MSERCMSEVSKDSKRAENGAKDNFDGDPRAYSLGILNGTLFRTNQALIGGATVLPIFLASLTDWKWLIGIGSSLDSAGWFLPQIVGSYFIARQSLRLPIYKFMGLIRIASLGILTILILLLGKHQPNLLLLCFMGLFLLYSLSGGIAGIAFLDMVGKIIPTSSPKGKPAMGSFWGWRIFLGGASGMMVGIFVVKPVLAGFEYPTNFAILFGIATMVIAVAIAVFSIVREREFMPIESDHDLKNHIRRSFRILKEDKGYRNYFITRHLFMLWAMGIPFYILFAQFTIELTSFWIGTFLASRFAGEMVFNVVWAWLSNRGHNRTVLKLSAIVSLLPVSIALAHSWFTVPMWLYSLCFFFIGGALTGAMIGGNNYLFRYVPINSRPLYIGVTNSTLGVTLLASGIGGLIVDYFSFESLFVVILSLSVLSILMTFSLKRSHSDTSH